MALLLARRQSSRLDSERLELAIPEERRLAVRVGPLSMGALHRLLRDRFGSTLARPALRRVHEASGGNPFYALELVGSLESSGGWTGPGQPLPVPETLEAILHERIDALPPGVRQVLAAAAALRRPTESMLGDWPALEQAAEAGLIELTNDGVSFKHPLLASAAYGSITAAERRRLHRRLAEVVSDPEERARHLALGAEGPDKEVADALEGAARQAAARGAPAAAAELAELAVRLTPKSERGRLLERSDRRRLVSRSLRRARHGRLDARARSRSCRRCRSSGRATAARERTTELQAVSLSSRSALWATLVVTMPALQSSSATSVRSCSCRAPLIEALEHARAALEPAERAADRTILATALSTVAWFETLSAVEPTPGLLERALALEEAAVQAGVYDSSSPGFALGMRLMFAGRLDEARARMDIRLERAGWLGDERAVAAALLHQAELELRAGNWSLAARKAAEGYERAEQIGREQDMSALLYASALVDAHLGRVEEARDAATAGLRSRSAAETRSSGSRTSACSASSSSRSAILGLPTGS